MLVKAKKIILVLVVLALLGVGVLLSPLILMLAADLVGRVTNPPFSLCKVMDKAQLEAAISQGFQVNSGCCTERMIGECSIAKRNSTALTFAIEAGNAEAMQLLLEHGADVNKSSDMGDALTVAAWLGRTEMIEALLSHGASPASQATAMRVAAHEGHTEIAARILDQLAPAQLPEACSSLFCGLCADLQQRGSPKLPRQRELFMRAVRACPDPNVVCKPWHVLSYIGREDENAPIVKALIERGADLNAREESGRSVREFLRSFNDYESRPKIKALIESAN